MSVCMNTKSFTDLVHFDTIIQESQHLEKPIMKSHLSVTY